MTERVGGPFTLYEHQGKLMDYSHSLVTFRHRVEDLIVARDTMVADYQASDPTYERRLAALDHKIDAALSLVIHDQTCMCGACTTALASPDL